MENRTIASQTPIFSYLMNTMKRGICSSLFLILIVSSLASAQGKSGSIVGWVLDDDDAVIPFADVELTRTDNSSVQRSRSNEDGYFIMSNLPFGRYILKATTPGIEIKPSIKVAITTSKPIHLDIRFELGCPSTNSSKGSGKNLSKRERGEIVRFVFVDAVLNREIVANSSSQSFIYIASENLDSAWIPIQLRRRVKVLSMADIQQRANKFGDFRYLSITPFESKATCTEIFLQYRWASSSSRYVYIDSKKLKYKFEKLGNKWVGHFISESVS